ncbi:MAG: division/cell wall cluster transcriptional repressor MraZ [Candidatus Eisenbacteria bacterium]
MEVVFKGQFAHSVDHKGRVSIPSSFRRVLTKRDRHTFTITNGLDGCLYLYPQMEWDKVQQRLKKLAFWRSDNRRFIREFLENAYDVEVDGQGRIKIPQVLIEMARLDREVLFLGGLDKIEVWNPRTYRGYRKASKHTFEEIAEKVFVTRED